MRHTHRTRGRKRKRRELGVPLLAVSLAVAIVSGLYTPGQQPIALTRLALIVFCLSMLMSLATLAVLVSAPPIDPAERLKRMIQALNRSRPQNAADRELEELGVETRIDRGEGELGRRRDGP